MSTTVGEIGFFDETNKLGAIDRAAPPDFRPSATPKVSRPKCHESG